MSNHRFRWAFFVILLIAISGAQSASPEDEPASGAITVSGKEIFAGGKPFHIHGVEIDATVAPPSWLESGNGGRGFPPFFNAYKHFIASGADELRYSRSYFGANTIEYYVSQPGFDEQNSGFSKEEHEAYIAEIRHAVALARQMGFYVILSDFNQILSGNTAKGVGFPDVGTLRVDVALARMFGKDRGILLELLTEPWPRGRQVRDARVWDEYINGGPGKPGHAEVGVNTLIKEMRAAGAENVIIVQPFFPLGWAAYPDGIVDPMHQFAFGIHPYIQRAGATRDQWDAFFGVVARDHPMIVTEWHQNTGAMGRLNASWCNGPKAPDLPRQELHYFDSVGMDGVVGWAFDIPGTLLDQFEGTATTVGECGAKGNIGAWLKDYFAGILR